MSWLFGIKPTSPSSPSPPSPSSAGGAPEGPGGSEEAKAAQKQLAAVMGNTESQYRFDSAALERAAKAAKELEKSVHARDLL